MCIIKRIIKCFVSSTVSSHVLAIIRHRAKTLDDTRYQEGVSSCIIVVSYVNWEMSCNTHWNTADTCITFSDLYHRWYWHWCLFNSMIIRCYYMLDTDMIHVLRLHISTVSISRDNTTCIGHDTCITALRLGGFDIPSCLDLIRTWYMHDTTLDTCINNPHLCERNGKPGAVIIHWWYCIMARRLSGFVTPSCHDLIHP